MNLKKEEISTKSIFYSEDDYNHVIPGLVYIQTSVPGIGIDKTILNSKIKECSCISVCKPSSCSCLNASGIKSAHAKLPDYINRIYPIFECHTDCSCDDSCSNKVTQKGVRCGLLVKDCGDKGFGVVTEFEIPKGSFICEYAGEIIGQEEAQKRIQSLRDTDPNYLLFLREHIGYDSSSKFQTTIIDPTTVGNIGRYINHSCSPNLRVVPVRTHCMIPIAALFAIRQIEAGEELTYNYNESGLDTGFNKDPHEEVFHTAKRCLCFSSNCKKYLPINYTI